MKFLHRLIGILLIGLLCADFLLELMPGITMGALPKLYFAAAITIIWTMYCLPLNGPIRRRQWLQLLFLYYLWLLANVLFFDGAFGRGAGVRPCYTPQEVWEMLRTGGVDIGISMEPLRTIHNYLSAYQHGNISRELMLLNLGGNLAAFAPFGFFLPALYRKQRNPILFLLTMGILIAAVELIQAYTGCGSADIDDLILNAAGAAAVWLLCLPLTGWICRPRERRKSA